MHRLSRKIIIMCLRYIGLPTATKGHRGKYYDLTNVLAYPRHPMRRTTVMVVPLKPLAFLAEDQFFVASNGGGLKEFISHNKTCVLFKAWDARDINAGSFGLAEKFRPVASVRNQWPEICGDVRYWKQCGEL